ncbi:MAG: 50S ribosomal protein L21 [Flavobacteriales bacterium]|nr:50S ribosomal protein L21 [Flavobacteriales bacterium]
MYAIVEIAGHQYKVEKDQLIFVNRLAQDEGAKVSFDNVLLIDNGGDVTVGAPAISGAQVSAKVQRHLKGDKVIIFNKKRRKGYRKKNGFRASLTEIKIDSIVASGAKPAKKAAPKKEEVKAEAKPEAAAAAAPAKEAPKKAAPKKAAAKGDDLKKIEGIGPKMAEILTNAGIGTFAELAKADVENIKAILLEAGSRYKMFDPTTWPQQAQLAADGKWDELKELQDRLDGGRE